MSSKRTAGTIWINLQISGEEFQKGFKKAESDLVRFGTRLQNIGQRITLGIGLPLATVGTIAVKSFAQFDQAMQESVAFMGATGKAMRKELIEGAKQVAATSKFSAEEAAKGYQTLGQAGLDASQSLAALPVVTDFATAAQSDLVSSTETLVQIQIALGLSSQNATENMIGMTRVADTLTTVSLATTTGITDLSEALGSQLAGTLRANNVTIEEAAMLLGVLGQQGIKGAKAGTALSVVIRELGIDFIKNSKAFKSLPGGGVKIFDDNGQMRSVVAIVRELDKALKGMSDLQRIAAVGSLGFTKKNSQFVQMFLGMGEELDRIEEKLEDKFGSNSRVAKEVNEGFGNQMAMVMHRIQNVAIAIGEDLAPAVLMVGKAFATMVESLLSIPEPVRHALEGVAALVVALGSVAFALGAVTKAWGGFAAIAGGNTIGAAILGPLVAVGTFLVSWPVLIVAALAAAAGAIYIFWSDIRIAAEDFINWFKQTFPDVATVIHGTFIAASNAVSKLSEDFNRGWEIIEQGASDLWNNKLPALIDRFIQFLNSKIPEFVQFAVQMAEAFNRGLGVISTAIDNLTGDFNRGIERIRGVAGSIGSDIVSSAQVQIDTESAANAQRAAAKEAATTAYWQEHIKKNQKEINDALNLGVSIYQKGTQELSVWAKKKEEENKAALKKQEERARLLNPETTDQTLARLSAEDNAKAAERATKKAAEAIATLDKKLAESRMGNIGEMIEQGLDTAIGNGDFAHFERMGEALKENIIKGTTEGLQDYVDKAGAANKKVAEARVAEIAQNEANTAYEKARERFRKGEEQLRKEALEEQKKSHEESAAYWKQVFTQATSDSVLDIKESLRGLFTSLASELAASISGGVKTGINSLEDVGKKVGAWLADGLGLANGGTGGDGILGSIGSFISSIFGTSPTSATDAWAQGIQGPAMEGGVFSAGSNGGAAFADAFAAGIQVITAAVNASDINDSTGTYQGTGGAVGGGAGAILGAAFGGPMGASMGSQIGNAVGGFIGGLFGSGSDPENEAREAFGKWIDEQFEKLSTVSFFNQDGKLEQSKGFDFQLGESDKFNTPGWADQITALGGETADTFVGLGNALKEMLGLTEDVGGQIAYLLMENLGGNIDNARLMVQQLGLSMDEMVEKLVEAGAAGTLSWHEVEVSIQGVTNAFAEGLVAVGDVSGAFEELRDSGGRGIAAIKAIKDIAVEALEAGITTLDGLKEKLLADGVDPAEVEALMAALQQRGITTLEELAKVSNRVGGGIVADIQSASATMAATWEDMTKKLEEVSEQLENIPKDIISNITFNVDANVSEEAQQVLDSGVAGEVDIPAPSTSGGTTAFAKGGLLRAPTYFGTGRGLGLAGEAGPEFLMPAQTMPDGTLGVRALGGGMNNKGTVIYVNAPNSSPGMEHKIADAIRRMGEHAVSQAVDVMENKRGRRY